MNRLTLILLFSLLILSVIGILPSLMYCDWEWFSRSGSILVLLGAYITWEDYKLKIELILDKHRKEIEYIKRNEKGIINGTMKVGAVDKDRDNSLKKIGSKDNTKSKAYRYTEIGIICTGTLIWGYGNLLSNFNC